MLTGVILQRSFPVSRLYLICGGSALDAQDLIRVNDWRLAINKILVI